MKWLVPLLFVTMFYSIVFAGEKNKVSLDLKKFDQILDEDQVKIKFFPKICTRKKDDKAKSNNVKIFVKIGKKKFRFQNSCDLSLYKNFQLSSTVGCKVESSLCSSSENYSKIRVTCDNGLSQIEEIRCR